MQYYDYTPSLPSTFALPCDDLRPILHDFQTTHKAEYSTNLSAAGGYSNSGGSSASSYLSLVQQLRGQTRPQQAKQTRQQSMNCWPVGSKPRVFRPPRIATRMLSRPRRFIGIAPTVECSSVSGIPRRAAPNCERPTTSASNFQSSIAPYHTEVLPTVQAQDNSFLEKLNDEPMPEIDEETLALDVEMFCESPGPLKSDASTYPRSSFVMSHLAQGFMYFNPRATKEGNFSCIGKPSSSAVIFLVKN